MNKIQSTYEALVGALVLSITAPTDELSEECVAMAHSFAASMTGVLVENAKKDALRIIGKKETGQ